MENFSTVNNPDINPDNISYEEILIKSEIGGRELYSFGVMIIIGLPLPKNPKFSVLPKIWASLKKPLPDSLGVSVAGCFWAQSLKTVQEHMHNRHNITIETPEGFNPNDDVIYAQFCLNYANKEDDIVAYSDQFRDTFYLLTLALRNTLREFLEAPEDGFKAYCDYVNSREPDEIDKEVCEEILNRFLAKQGLRTEETKAIERAKKKALEDESRRKKKHKRSREETD